MANVDDARLLVKIARLYYEGGAIQAGIADLIGLSCPLISKFLQMGVRKELCKSRFMMSRATCMRIWSAS